MTEIVSKHYKETRSYETSKPENKETITQAIYDVSASEL